MGLFPSLTTKFNKRYHLTTKNQSVRARSNSATNICTIIKARFLEEQLEPEQEEQRFLATGLEPNAAVADNMAPALTEPLSPTDKLSSSTATPTTRSSSRKIEPLASTSTSPISITSTTVKEKKNRSAAANPTTSTRVTRSKDAYQRVFEQALTHTPIAVATNANPHTSNQKNANSKKSNNDQMGLSAALNNNNNNNNNHNKRNEASPNLNPIITTACKDNSTEQLLADLTNDFEEAITAEICLRKQLEDVNLGKSVSDSHTESEAKDIIVIKGGSGGRITPGKLTEAEHMESPQKVESTPSSSNLHYTEGKPKNELTTKGEKTEPQIERREIQIEREPHLDGISVSSEKHDSAKPQIPSVEELPPVSTDSTMTASEVEDNLEERLSQLDGTAIVPATSEVSGVVDAMCVVPATPPRTPQQQTHQQQVLQLQQQLQQTPPTPLCQQVQQQHTLTPQSTTSSVNTLSSASFTKETTTSGSAELEDPDIEEVLKALKGFDASSGGDALPDLNVLFNEVYTTLNNYEEINSQPTSSGASKPNPLIDILTEIEKKQQSMHRKMDFLLRRMRKLQVRNMCKHTSEEVAGLFEYSARVASKGSPLTHSTQEDIIEPGLGVVYNAVSVRATRPFAFSWSEEQRNPVSSAQIFSMLRKLEAVANAQQLCTAFATSTHVWGTSSSSHGHLRKSKKVAQDALSGLPTTVSITEPTRQTVVPTLAANVSEELAYVAGLLQTEMREVQNAIDSDATESSSGGESADEMVTYNNQVQQSLSIAKRAAWRYSRDRAAIASRWSWLLSQIADLEIKIRQHSELHQEIVRTKGAVTCGGPDDATAVNGYKGDISLAANTVHTVDELKGECEAGELPSSCRTRGYVATQFRKRKLLQTTNIHTISKKAARPSTIKCGCQWPLLPCALCTGRCDPTAPRDLPDTMMMPDRIALLDPGYHPVLSFPEEVSNLLHFEAIARLPEWQQRVMRCQAKSIAKGVWKAEREAAAAAGHHPTTKRRYIKKKDRIAAGDTAATATTTATVVANPSSDAGGGGGVGGNCTGTLSTTSATPLVANKLVKNSKKLHCHLVGDGVLLEPLSPLTTNSNHSGQSQNNSYIHQTSDYPHPPNFDPYNHNQTHSSSISNSKSSSKNSKNRKLSSTSAAATNTFHHHHPNINNFHQQHYYNNSQHYYSNNTSNGGSDTSFLYAQENNWDSFAVRSRTSSPTHGGSGGGGSSINYHKYERSLDRKNRSSYDIDNIVIPYSVAAATRVEILPYKEIPTPKWRVIDEEARQQISELKANAEKVIQNVSEVGENSDSPEEHHAISNGLTSAFSTADATEIVESLGTKRITQNNASDNELSKESKDAEMRAIDDKCDEAKGAEQDQDSPVVFTVTIATAEKGQSRSIVSKEPPEKMTNNSGAAKGYASIVEKDTSSELEPAVKKLKTESAEANEIQVIANVTANYEGDEFANDNDSEDVLTDEDITDDAMMLRHERALTEERRKFQTFLKFPWSTRSRANRRIDSRAESSGANTPDPTSPAQNTPSVGGGDQESIPSPLAPSTPLNPLESVSETAESALVAPPPTTVANNLQSKRYERRRTTSAKKEPERRSSTPDPKELIPPYEPLKFPLPDEVFENLLHTMPSEFQDNQKFQVEDSQNVNIKYIRSSRNNFRNEPFVASSIRRTSKSTTASMICDVNVNSSWKQKAASNCIFSNKTGKGAWGSAGGGRGTKAIYENGKAEDIDDATDAVLDDEDEQEDDEYDEDYPRHHLAPPPEDDEYIQHNRGDDAYDAYVGGTRSMLSDGESSDMEPFQDDDPNDPEWKGESEERAERLRKKL